jgi:hypothetical protein
MDMNNIPPKVRIALAMKLLQTLPPTELDAVRRAARVLVEPKSESDDSPADETPQTQIEIIDGTGMTPEQLQAKLSEFGIAPGQEPNIEAILNAPEKRPLSPEEVAAFNTEFDPPLKVGDRVRWRPGYRNAGIPGADDEVVVSQIISPPVRDLSDCGHINAACRHDIAIAFRLDTPDQDGPVVSEFLYDSRRFMRVVGPVEGGPADDPQAKAAVRKLFEVSDVSSA